MNILYYVLLLPFILDTICIIQSANVYECDKDTLLIRGDTVRFSDFTGENGEIDKSRCKTENGLRILRIFAVSKVIIDSDLKAFSPSFFKLTVFAPTWEITGSTAINLNGKKIEQDEKSVKDVNTVEKARSARGDDGRSGAQGNQGGNFVGIGDGFINENHLTISVRGGNGTDGTDGGRGGNGRNGTYPDYRFLKSDGPRCIPLDCSENTELMLKNNKGKKEMFRCNVTYTGGRKLYRVCKFRIQSNEGNPSGSGGDGGKGGLGGYPGTITLMNLGRDIKIKKDINTGNHGKDGKGGKAGNPGSHGDNIRIYVEAAHIYNIYYHGVQIDNGKDGRDGFVNNTGYRSKENINPLDIANDVVDYKGFLLENLNLSDAEDFRVKFYFKLEKNHEIMSMFDTLSFVNELKSLEKRFHKNQDRLNYIQLYQSLSNRTAEFAKQPKIQSSMEEKKVLTYLYTTVLNREYNLKDRSDTNLVVNVYDYLKIVEGRILKHNELKRTTTMQEYSETYNRNIQTKTDEASKLINDVILPEINKALEENKGNINEMLKNIIGLQDATEDQKKELQKEKVKLEGQLFGAAICDMLSIASDFIAFIPVVGTAASVLTKVGTGIARHQMGLDEKYTLPDRNQFMPQVAAVVPSLDKLTRKSMAKFKKVGDLSLKVLKKHKFPKKVIDKVTDLSKKASESKTAEGIRTIRQELSEVFKKQLEEYKNKTKQPVNVQDLKIVIESLYKASQSDFAADLVEGLLPTFSANKKKIEELNDAIEEQDQKLEQLKEFENSISSTMGPALDNMGNAITKAADELKGKSHASLDVTQWQIQKKLKEMGSQMEKISKGLNSSELFSATFTKVQDAINTLVKVYDRIQSYQDQKTLANLITDINSAGSHRIKVSDPKLTKAIDYLELIISCNTVIQMYTTVMDAFKQFVFPLAKKYLSFLLLPSYLEYGESVEELVEKARTQIAIMKEQLDQYRSTAKRHDAWIGKSQFNSQYTSTKPFYVWDFNKNSDIISSLLSGEEVIVYSDVKESPLRYDALKIRKIEINFKVKEKKTQEIINNVLDEFRIAFSHMGNSYFRIKNQYFLLTTGRLDFIHSLEKDRQGQAIDRNEVIEKIEKGDAMLSPYTSWTMQLIHMSDMDSEKFKILQLYKQDIAIELVGVGSYINRKSIMKENIEVDKYYSPVTV